ncbi:MAG: hypothetical protein RIG63_08345 [Coleofasciculus chthonoplastes F3-SA18-01]|uniref:hypothetical protein n=1 Tax=Coleofasciculus TaxID=669368 RepID=UPI0033050DF4
MASLMENLSHTYRSLPRWDMAEDIKGVRNCISNKNYRAIMSGDWDSEETLREALNDMDDQEYAEWCLAQNKKFREIAIKDQLLYDVVSRYRHHIIDHGGMCAEFGVFRGHSINKCASIIPERQWYGFDSFEGFESDWNTYQDNYSVHKTAFSLKGGLPKLEHENISLIKGYYSQSLPKFLSGLTPDQYFSLVHIDCDIFEAAKCIFQNLGNRFIPGTIIVLDESVGLCGISDVLKAFYDFVRTNDIKFQWLGSGKGPNEFTVLDRGWIMTHWLFAYKTGMCSSACILQ